MLEIKNDFGDFYTATVVTMLENKNEWYEHTTIAVRKEDCYLYNNPQEYLNEKNTN